MGKSEYEVVWPRGRRTMETMTFASRLDNLEGKTICELWNWAFRGNQIFPAIEKELTERYPGIKFVSYEVFGATYGAGANEAKVLAVLPDKLRQNKCDAVISATGC